MKPDGADEAAPPAGKAMPTPTPERRGSGRVYMSFDKAFPVLVGSEIYGNSSGIARNISPGGMLVEMFEPLPLSCMVTVHFRMPDSHGEVCVRAEVKHHYCFNFSKGDQPSSTRGIGLRFVEFVEDSAESFARSYAHHRILH